MVFLFAAGLGFFLNTGQAASGLAAPEGHINFYKHTTPADDLYTANPSPADVQFMNTRWARLLTYSGYWDNKLSWFSNAWMYADAVALYSDPNNTLYAQLLQMHPDWILRDSRGNPLYINWGCGGGTCPQYAANLSDPNGFRAWWIQEIRLYLDQNPPYKGIFIDDVNLDLSLISDGSGNPAAAIDPITGRSLTENSWRAYFADFLEQVRAAFPKVEIVHNSLWYLDWTDSNIQRQIRAADWINLERGVNDPGLTGGAGYWSLDRLLTFIDNVHQNGKGVILDGEAPASNSGAAREYSTAVYLLISTGADLVGDSSQTPTDWWSGFDIDLGKAATGRYLWQNLWRRDFAAGIALVNPPGGDAVVITLPGPYTRVDGSVVNTIRLGPAEGAILNSPPPSGLSAIPSSVFTTPSSVSAGPSGVTSASSNISALPSGVFTPVSALSALNCTPAILTTSDTPVCTVTLTAPAPPAGAKVYVSSSSNLQLSVPDSIFVPAGASSAMFTAALAGTDARIATILARMGSISFGVTLRLAPSGALPAHLPILAP